MGGVDNARFVGINNTNSKYITFLDADDWLNNDFLEIHISKIEEFSADIVESGFIRRWGFFHKKHISSEQFITQPKLQNEYFVSFFGKNILKVNMWGKLYRTDIIKSAKLKPSGYKMGEDLFFNLYLFPHINKYVVINYAGYNYRAGGLTSNYNPHLFTDLKEQYFHKLQLIEKYNYKNADRLVRIEMKNILKTHLQQLITYKILSKQELQNFLESEFNYSLPFDNKVNYIDDIVEKIMPTKDNFVYAIKDKNSLECIRITTEYLNQPKHKIKRVVKQLIQRLNN